MFHITEGHVVRTEQSTIPYTLIRGEQPNKSICIMLPGLGYSTERPLFHYATGVCLNQNVDVLHINYNFGKNEHFKKLNNQQQESWLYDDVNAVVAEVLKATNYEQFIVLSKSIGTIPMAKEWNQRNFIKNAYGIWLTPLLKIDAVYDALLKTELPSLCVIGDDDHHYIEERISSLKTNEHVSTVVIPKADHGLEIKGDTVASIDIAKEIFVHLHDFIAKNKIKE